MKRPDALTANDDVSAELIVMDSVRSWLNIQNNDSPVLARKAVDVAIHALMDGASISEACAEARRWVDSWRSHPSHQERADAGPNLAS